MKSLISRICFECKISNSNNSSLYVAVEFAELATRRAIRLPGENVMGAHISLSVRCRSLDPSRLLGLSASLTTQRWRTAISKAEYRAHLKTHFAN